MGATATGGCARSWSARSLAISSSCSRMRCSNRSHCCVKLSLALCSSRSCASFASICWCNLACVSRSSSFRCFCSSAAARSCASRASMAAFRSDSAIASVCRNSSWTVADCWMESDIRRLVAPSTATFSCNSFNSRSRALIFAKAAFSAFAAELTRPSDCLRRICSSARSLPCSAASRRSLTNSFSNCCFKLPSSISFCFVNAMYWSRSAMTLFSAVCSPAASASRNCES
mmetsp:Transcript_25897/g.59797  ORF Transcript_25897/g.59797 Transcript_25897/m.59797 type:complete len:230 (+) Transcript_25897:739-1428(+)